MIDNFKGDYYYLSNFYEIDIIGMIEYGDVLKIKTIIGLVLIYWEIFL